MNAFLTTARLVLTPLAPIHIGADEDFEPTNYVIEGRTLYAFNPAKAQLPPLLQETLLNLVQRVEQCTLFELQKFFYQNRAYFIPHANIKIPVAAGIANQYQNRIDSPAQQEMTQDVINKLAIERTIYNPLTALPYIPGSSVKGALRTALLQHLVNTSHIKISSNDIERDRRFAANLEKQFFGKDFHLSPLRLLKISDFMSANQLRHEIIFSKNFPYEQGKSGAPDTRQEVISELQFRSLTASVTLQARENRTARRKGEEVDLMPKKSYTIQEVAEFCNDFYLKQLRSQVTDRRLKDVWEKTWLQKITALLEDSDFQRRIQSNQAFILRLGRFGGKASKVLEQAFAHKPPKTTCLSARLDNKKNSIPFGWAVVEIEQSSKNLETWSYLQRWCNEKVETDAQKVAEQAAREQAEQVRLAAKANMTDNQCAVTELADAIAKRAEQLRGSKEKQNGDFHSRAKKLVEQAKAAGNWTDDEKTALKNLVMQDLPQVVENMSDAKEQRKRFKLNDL